VMLAGKRSASRDHKAEGLIVELIDLLRAAVKYYRTSRDQRVISGIVSSGTVAPR